jgi:uncharacterized protein YbjQ (UPF0145 family)
MPAGAPLNKSQPSQPFPQAVEALQNLFNHQQVEQCEHRPSRKPLDREVQAGAYQINFAAQPLDAFVTIAMNPNRTQGEPAMPIRVEPMMVTTSQELPGYRIVRNYGIVRGIIVRSRSLLGSIGAGLQTIIGGNITILTELCEKTREEAYELMMQHAAQHGANAVIAMRYDATEIMQGVTEVLAYGTAVQVERIS